MASDEKGSMLIIGDIGVGKTMVAQALLAKSVAEYLKTIYIGNAGNLYRTRK